MSTEPTLTRSQGRFWTSAYVEGMTRRGEILPGSAAKILALVHDGDRGAYMPAEAMARLGVLFADPSRPVAPVRAMVRDWLVSRGVVDPVGDPKPDQDQGLARCYLNMERPAPEKPESALRAVLRRFNLSDHHASALYDIEAVNVAGADEAALPGAVVAMLMSPTHRNRQPWPDDPLSPTGEKIAHILTGLKTLGEIARDTAVDATARAWENELGRHGSYERLLEAVIGRIATRPAYWAAKDFKPNVGAKELDPPPPTESELAIRESVRAFACGI